MSNKNLYENLKLEPSATVAQEPVREYSTDGVAVGRQETVMIHTSELSDGSWVYGYTVYWSNGLVSVQKPMATLGVFRTERDAKLYALGFMLQYRGHFRETTKMDLERAERELQQTNLFT